MSASHTVAVDDPKISIAQGAMVIKDCVLEGEITIGTGTIVHPKATIRALRGPIIIGENNIIEETTVIENNHEEGFVMKIGNENVFEVGALVRARSVGNHNVFHIRSEVGSEVEVSEGCSIGVKCTVDTLGPLADRFVVYGERHERRIAGENPQSQVRQLECLYKCLPRYHYHITTKAAGN
ncbi:hypothetical protein QR680_009186 [Steinernema hermaphroditum]|uniref:Dynactin subunit 6 n=1 Tax=Steinernema hermaphroditum TaxID=289476 RepID=A0AA39ILR9_9BILA|nr:hypothetical protein QR680_009186 [Steinernema hermaphroditum]